MGPDKRFCQICDGVSVVGCSFKGGSLCKPERVRMPPSADRNRDDIATIAADNGYVKLADDEMVVKLRSAHDPERARRKDMCHIEIDALAKSAGYIKLADDEIVMPRELARELIAGRCDACEDEGLSDCRDCEIKPIRDKVQEVKP